MRDNQNTSISSKVLSVKSHRRYLRVFAFVALVVALTVAGMLRQHGVALTRTETVLDCQYSGDGAHTHNDDCYDADGKLVCPLEERELHEHDDACYTEEEVLVCGLDEGEIHAHTLDCLAEDSELVCDLEETEGHEHTDECYDEDGELVCGEEESEGHVHTVDCYDGELVCGKRETEGHVHTDECYDEDDELVCGLDEGEIHAHTDECYDEDDELVCGKWETEGHEHSDDCYKTKRKLTCDKEEVLEEHVHGPGCFKTSVVMAGDDDGKGAGDDVTAKEAAAEAAEAAAAEAAAADAEAAAEAAAADAAAEADAEPATAADAANKPETAALAEAELDPASLYPAQSFSEPVRNKDGKKVMTVSVEAPEGAFPAGTTMEVSRVTSSDVEGVVADAMAAADVKHGVDSLQAVDIVFRNADGDKIEPLCAITVSMSSNKIANEGTNPLLIHVDDTGKGEVVDQLSAEQVADRKLETSDDTIVFDADAFSVYVVAYISADYLSDSGELYEVTVNYDDDARIPEGASLKVTEFADGSLEFAAARKAVVADLLARGEDVDLNALGLAALDISILDADGNEIEPAAPVQVDMKIKALPGVEALDEVADTLAVQHHVETEDGVVVETVFDSSAEASFVMDTNEAVAAEGTPVDPESVDLSQLGASVEALYAEAVGADAAAEDEAEAEDEVELEVSFPTEAFSTFTVTWGTGGGPETYPQLQIGKLENNGKYILYGQDTADESKYYALVPGTTLQTVEVTVSDGSVQYEGTENLYWNAAVTTSGMGNNNVTYYEFSFTEGNKKYYLVAGNDDGQVGVSTSSGNYGNANTSKWKNNNNKLQSKDRNTGTWNNKKNYYTYLRCENGVFKVVEQLESDTTNPKIYFEKERSQGASFSGSQATIHYVDEQGNELTVVNGQPLSDVDGSGYAYLIYDIDGYEYSYTYRNEDTNGNKITPALQWKSNNKKWYYSTGTNFNSEIKSGDNIYVVYKKKKVVPQGGTPKLKETVTEPELPTITKSSEVNGDGTNTLSLSVLGHTTDVEVEKLADVIVVFDVSGSMKEDMDGNKNNVADKDKRLTLAKNATLQLANDLFAKNEEAGTDLIRMGLITFSNTANTVLELTDNKDAFTNAVKKLSADGGTNWEYALQLANEMDVDPDRATFVIFVTDGNPTFRRTRAALSNTAFENDFYNISYFKEWFVYGIGSSDVYNRNFDAALVQATSIVSHNKDFYTIGISNDVDVENLTDLVTGAGENEDHSKGVTTEQELNDAFDEFARSVIALKGHSDINIVDGITELTQTVRKSDMVDFAEDDFTYYKGHAATQEEVRAGKASRVGDMVWVEWSPASERCELATYNTETGAVEWHMGDKFMPQDGYTYQVRFKVWPSQEAYDLIAGLNNGIYVMDDDAEVIRKTSDNSVAYGERYYHQISGTYPNYHLKTNAETSYTYCEATKTGSGITITSDPCEPGSFPEVDPLDLTTKPLKIMKRWYYNYSASRDAEQSIDLELYGVNPDGTTTPTFKTITLTGDAVVDEHGVSRTWYSDNNFISYGLVTLDKSKPNENTEKIYETGHDFTLREIGENAHYYELSAGIYRPMVINGTNTVLELVDEAPAGMSSSAFYYKDGNGNNADEYYRLDGKVYRDTKSDIILIATNSRRSLLDLTKQVVDENGNAVASDDLFDFSVTITVPAGIDNYEDMEEYIWFSVVNENNKRLKPGIDYTYTGAFTPDSIDPVAYPADKYGKYLVANSGEQITLRIKAGWNVRFLNLPIGTTYSFEETNLSDAYSFVSAVMSGTRWEGSFNDAGVDVEDQSKIVDMTGLPSNNGSDPTNTVLGGTIDYANAQYKATYTNRTTAQEVKILKVGENGQGLAGAKFDLKKRANGTSFVMVSSFTSAVAGNVLHLAPGVYCVTETSAPDGYVIAHNETIFEVREDDDVLRLVVWSEDGGDYVAAQDGDYQDASVDGNAVALRIVNHPGAELPSTGGTGTHLFGLLGTTITALAGAGVVVRVRRSEEV